MGYLYGWTQFAITYTGSAAAKGAAFAVFLNVLAMGHLDVNYFTLHAFGHDFAFGRMQVVSLSLVTILTLVNCLAVSVSGNIASFLTTLKVLLIVAVGAGVFFFAKGDWMHFALNNDGGTCEGVASGARGGLAGFGAAMLAALWAYDGWSNVTPLLGEIHDPERTVPKVFVRGMLLVGALYMFANIAYFYVLTPEQIASVSTSSSVATEVLRRFMGPVAVSLTALALMVSSFSSLQASVLSNARVPFAMARDGLFFRALAPLSPRTHVPVRAIIAQAAWSSLLVLTGSYDTLTDAVIFASFLFYGLAAGSVFVLRRRFPDAARPYRAFGYPWAPAIFVIVTVFLLANTFIATPREALEGVLVLAVGIPFYRYWTRRGPHTAGTAGVPEGGAR